MDRLKGIIAANADAPLAKSADAVLTATGACGPRTDDQTLLLVRVRLGD